MLASFCQEDCWKGTRTLLDLLSDTGYKVFWKKAQICRQTVRYLGFVISKGHKALGPERKRAIYPIPQRTTKKEVREFLGVAGFCRIWIPGFSNIAKPLYQATVGSGKELLKWKPEQEKAFKEIKRLPTSASALRPPDMTWEFHLFVCEKNRMALGILMQMVGPWQRPVAYQSKRLDTVALGWPPCLWALAAVVALVREADKLTLGQNVNVKVSHAVTALMSSQGHKWH